jgi:hypothetical protein
MLSEAAAAAAAEQLVAVAEVEAAAADWVVLIQELAELADRSLLVPAQLPMAQQAQQAQME